jgi:CheY-like chemotaxis protein
MKRQFKAKQQGQRKFPPANGNSNGNGNGRFSMVNQRVPDAGIYSAPMDHSYRMQQDSAARRESTQVLETPNVRPIVAFVDDLFFMAKIQETARKLNVKISFAKSEKEVLEPVAAGEEKPSLVIIDLNHHTVKPLTVVSKIKGKLKKETNIIGFLSHLQGELKVKAQEAGCDMVLPRSAFSQNLPQLLRRHATSEAEAQEY